MRELHNVVSVFGMPSFLAKACVISSGISEKADDGVIVLFELSYANHFQHLAFLSLKSPLVLIDFPTLLPYDAY